MSYYRLAGRLFSLSVTFCCLYLPRSGFSQAEGTLYFMESVPQVTYINPALFPRYNFSVGLPGSSVQVTYLNNMFSYGDFTDYKEGKFTYDVDKLFNFLGKGKSASVKLGVDLFRLSAKVSARTYFTWSLSTKVINNLSLPEGTVGIFQNGEIAFDSGPTDIQVGFDATGYAESRWSFGVRVNKDMNVGVGIKWIKGIYNASVSDFHLVLSGVNNGVVSSALDMNINTSGIHNLTDNNFDLEKQWKEYKNNDGFAIDLGFRHRIADRLTLGFSLIDFGRIYWRNDLYNYHIDPLTKDYSFTQIDLERILNGDTDYLQERIDSVKNHYELLKDTETRYKTRLPLKFYLSTNFEIRRNFKTGLLFMGESVGRSVSWGLSTSLHKEFGRRAGISLSYTYRNRSYDNIGLGLSLNLAPLQIYLVGDNLLTIPVAYYTSDKSPEKTFDNIRYFNIRLGLNWVVGWDKTQERRPYTHQRKRLGIY